MRSRVPASRVRAANDAQVAETRDYVLYWMIAARRTRHSFALERAAEHAAVLGKPLVVLEALRAAYRHASDRHHAFAIDGMRDNAARLGTRGVAYVPYVEPSPGAGRGLLAALAARACVVVTDDYPCFFLPRMVASAAQRLDVCVEAVDGNGVLPMRAVPRVYARAYDFRRFWHRELGAHLAHVPAAEPLDGKSLRALPPGALDDVHARWAPPSAAVLAGDVSALPIDHAVQRVATFGGAVAGEARLRAFVATQLSKYLERNHPDADAQSGLSPYLHWGHVSAHEVFAAAMASSPSEARDGFLDQLVTWRELGFHTCLHRDDYDRYDGVPSWARASLEAHRHDAREAVYDLADFEAARTHDPLWNAAQKQLVRDGVIHNYVRMLWGKKILEWSARPEDAFAWLVHLNDKYAIDGRDPNSYTNISWVFGRFDRPWPERAVYGVVRSMSSASTRKKVHLAEWLARYA